MTVTINGTTGIDKVQDGSIQAADLASGVPSRSQLPAGTVLQVVSTTFVPAYTTTTSTSYVNSGLSLGITLSSASNKVLVLVNGGHAYVTAFPNGMIETICRQSSTTYDSSKDLSGAVGFGFTQIYNSTNLNTAPHSMNVLDTPATTTPTYRVFFRSRNGGEVIWQEGNSAIVMTLMEIAA